MKEIINNLKIQFDNMLQDANQKVEDLKVSFLGKKGKITELMQGLRDIPAESRREVGMSINNFKGYVENISKEIYNAKAFVMTSNFEGMPNALIEAMCIGLPCISTDCDGGGAKDLIDNNSNGILINKNNDIELVNAMEKILDDDFSNLISKNSKTLAKRLSYDKIYGEWEKYIRKIVRKWEYEK